MQPFVVDPVSYNKSDAANLALEYIGEFLEENNIKFPNVIFAQDLAMKPPGRNPWHDKGWYWKGLVFVNLKKSRVPVKVPGFQWSFTGYKADLTAPGVLAHETGHHVHFELDRMFGTFGRAALLERLLKVRNSESPVSGYEPNVYETFAESMRLFILNPNLLRVGRPERFRMLIDVGLNPLHDRPWDEVLVNAHPRLISAASSWIER